MIQTNIGGLIAAPFTPMHPNGSLHLEIISDYYQLLRTKGVKGVFICGTNGEGVSLTLEEKKAVAETWARCIAGDKSFTVMQMVGGNSIEECKQLALHAQSIGLNAISFISPFYFKPATIKMLAACCAEVAAVVPDMPFFYYHIPQFTGVYFSMYELLQNVHGVVPNFSGIKYSHDDITDFASCVSFANSQYTMLWGRDQSLLTALQHGAKGGVGSTYNYAAPLYLKMMEAFYADQLEKAKLYQQHSIDLIHLIDAYGGIATGKAFMRIIGLDCGEFRLPVQNMSASEFLDFKQSLEKLNISDIAF